MTVKRTVTFRVDWVKTNFLEGWRVVRFERESERRNIRLVERDRDVVTLRLNPQLYLLLECADESVNQLALIWRFFFFFSSFFND